MDYMLSAPVPMAYAAIGIASASVFRRYEPSITSFLCVLAAVASSARLATVPEWDSSLFSASPGPTLASVGSFLVALSAAILHYRLLSSSHPLHNIPGPIMARATKWWLFKSVVTGGLREDFTAVHAKYGRVVRIAPNEISIADAAAVLPIHGAKSWVRGKSYASTVFSKRGEADDNASLLNLIDHEAHAPRRRMWDKAFTISSLRDYEPQVINRISQLCEQLDARTGTSVDGNLWLGFLVFDVASDLAFGGGTNFLKDGKDTDGIVAGVVASMRLQGRLLAIPWISGIIAYTPLASRSKPFMSYSLARAAERIKNGNPTGGKDFLHHLSNEGNDTGKKLSMHALGADSAQIMAAGADTTRIAMAVIFMYMLRKPELYRRLQKEIDAALKDKEMVHIGDEEFPAHDLLKNIPLMDAYINESLRVHPSLSIEPLRQAPDEGAVIAGLLIPGGTQVRVPSHVIQRDPANFDRADEYDPDRWIVNKIGDENAGFNRAAFLPFLFGPFHCAGKQFAYQEMRLFLATLLWKYDMKFAPGFDSYAWERSIEDNGTLLEIHEPLDIIFTRRSA